MLCHIVHACIHQCVTPFVFTLEEDQRNLVYQPPLQSEIEQRLIHNLGIEDNITARALDELPVDAAITHVNAIGPAEAINAVLHAVNDAIKAAATAVIGHHDDEGIARFLPFVGANFYRLGVS